MCEVIHLAGTDREILSTKWKFSLLAEQIIYKFIRAHARDTPSISPPAFKSRAENVGADGKSRAENV